MALPIRTNLNVLHPLRVAVKQQSRASPWRARAAWLMLGLTILFSISMLPLIPANYNWAVSYHELSVSGGMMLLSEEVGNIVSELILAVLGMLIIFARPQNRIGWLFVVGGAFTAVLRLSGHYALYAYMSTPESQLPLRELAFWFQNWNWLPVFFIYGIALPLLFPNGRLPSKHWRWLLLWGGLVVGLEMFLTAFHPNPYLQIYFIELEIDLTNPYGIALVGDLFPREIIRILFALFIATHPIAAVSLVMRYIRADRDTRQQIKWFGLGLVVLLVLFVVRHFDNPWLYKPGLLGFIKIVSIIVSISLPFLLGISIFKYRLYDIDVVINRTLVYGALTALIVGIYVVVVGALGVLLQASNNLAISLFATGAVAVLFQPLRVRLQRAVNRVMYGERDEPYQLLAHLGQQLSTVTTPGDLLPTIVEIVTNALKLPYAGIAIQQGNDVVIRAQHGEAVSTPHRIALIYQNEEVGQLIVGHRMFGEALTEADLRTLADIARQIGAAVHAVRLTEDLQRSRERLVTTREEERRRMRRDLHDGLGPALASQTLKLDAAIDLLETDPDHAIQLLKALKTQSQTLVADVRRLVYDLHPPALDELGLLGSLHAHIPQLTPYQNGLTITIDAPATLPELSAAVEVAAYRIAQEAVTNVIKHARAARCTLQLAVLAEREGDCLQITVSDDGGGLSGPLKSGVGLQSMRERAEELGGQFSAHNLAAGGFQIAVQLPLATTENVS